MNYDGLRFRGTGHKKTMTKDSTTNLDYKLTEDRYIDGVEIFLQNQHWDDKIKFQVVDVDNILGYGAGIVLDEFSTDWNISTETERQGPYLLAYPALIKKDLYLRYVYVSAGTVNDVKFKANSFLHKKPA